jgi:hypothetical protein
MSIHYDEKGKFYTEIVSKDPRAVIIQTLTNRIRGTVYVRRGERLIDELRDGDRFMAVTDAILYDLKGTLLMKSDFMSINRDQIVWIAPEEEVHNEPSQEGGQT